MDFKSYSMLGGDEGSQPSLVKYSDPSHTPASVRYSVKSESTFHTGAVRGDRPIFVRILDQISKSGFLLTLMNICQHKSAIIKISN